MTKEEFRTSSHRMVQVLRGSRDWPVATTPAHVQRSEDYNAGYMAGYNAAYHGRRNKLEESR